MKVRKRTWTGPDGKPQHAYQMDYTDPQTGKRKRPNLEGVTSMAEANREAALFYSHLTHKHRAGENARPSPVEQVLTLKQLLDADRQRPGITERTRKSELCHAQPLQRILGEEQLLLDLTTSRVEHFKKTRLQERVKRSVRKVGPRTINLSLELLRAALKRAAQNGIFTQKLPTITKLAEPAKRRPHLTDKQTRALLEECTGELRDIVMLLAGTGLRPAELWRMIWSDIDFNRGELWVASHKRGGAGEMTSATLPLSKPLVALLETRKKSLRPSSRHARVFPTQKGVVNLGKLIKRAARAAAIPHWSEITPYTLRHSFATNLLQSHGATLKDVQALMRHTDPALTLRLYAQESTPDMRSAVEKAGKATFGTSASQRPRRKASQPQQLRAKSPKS